jgi:dolichyl-phosphate-mannose-protein mannosyltransferase
LAPALALAAVIAWAAFLVSSQPVTSPWWTYADADATYTATALNLTNHNSHARYLDHPGLPLHELLATSFLVERLTRAAAGEEGVSQDAFFAERMLNLDTARPLYRGWAIAFYLAGAVLSFLAAARLLGHWTWGLAAGLLWTAAPGLLAMAIQYRPDVPLSVLTLAVGYLTARAALSHSGVRYLAAALLLGFAVTVKLHAAGLLVPLGIAALWRPPRPGWWDELRRHAAMFVRRRPFVVAAGVLVWLVLLVTFNRARVPFTPTGEQRSLVVGAGGILAVYFGVTAAVSHREVRRRLRALFNPFYAGLLAAISVGILVPATIVLDDGLQVLVVIRKGLTGGGVNEEIDLFSASLDQLVEFPLRQATFVFVLAGAAAVLGIARREPVPVLLFSGAVILALMAQARLATTHYFAPAYVLSVPAALWLFRVRGGARASLLVWPIVAFLVFPTFEHRNDADLATSSFVAREKPALELVERLLQPGEVGLVPSTWPHPDSRYYESVHVYVEHTPDYRYRFLPDVPSALAFAAERGLRPRYFVGPVATEVVGTMPLELTTGTYSARRLPGVVDAVELLSGPSG